MDPELQALLARARGALAKGKSVDFINSRLTAGGAPAFADLVKMEQQAKAPKPTAPAAPAPAAKPPIGVADVARSAGQGATMGWLDELLGAFAAAPTGPAGYTPGHPEMYEPVRNAVRSSDSAFKANHPVASAASEIGGAIAVPGIGLSKLLGPAVGAMSPVMRAGAGIAGSGLSGAITNAGAASDVADVPNAAVEGLASGGGAGAIVNAAIPVAGVAARTLTGPILPKAMGRAAAVRAIKAAASRSGLELEPGILTTTPAERLSYLAKKLNGITAPKEAAEEIAKARLSKVGAEVFGPLDKAYPVLPKDPRLLDIIEDPDVAPAWRRVTKAGRDEGDFGFTHVQQLRRQLGRMLDNPNIDPALASHLKGKRRELTAVIEDLVPGFAHANKTYSATATTVDGFDQGFNAFKKKLGGDAVKTELAALKSQAGADEATAAEEAYRHGFVDAFAKHTLGLSKGRNVGRDVASLGKARSEAIEAVFKSKEAFETFIDKAKSEGRFSELIAGAKKAAAIVGGPRDALPGLTVPDMARRAVKSSKAARETEDLLRRLQLGPNPALGRTLSGAATSSAFSPEALLAPAAGSGPVSSTFETLIDRLANGRH